MRIIFMGTSSFAVPSLLALLASRHEVIAAVTQPDRPAGRGRQLRVSAVKEAVESAGIPVFQPEKVRAEDFVATVRELAPDLCVVAAFGQIIPKALLDVPRHGNINVHASLLPKYRGAAPVHCALFSSESVTGVTTMLMDPGLDTGPMLLRREVEILPDDDEASLESRLAQVGAELLIETIDELEAGRLIPRPQDGALATYAPSVKKEQCEIDWSLSAKEIVGRVRGCTPRPGAYTFRQGSQLRVWRVCAIESPTAGFDAGRVLGIGPDGIVVGSGDGAVLIAEVQPESKKRMPAVEFARGYRIAEGEIIGAESGR